jgi:membrane-associated phospholipid phosphatase
VSFSADYARRSLGVRAAAALAITLAFLLVPALADQWVFAHWSHPNVYGTEWGRLLRIMGWWPTWVIAAIALYLQQRGSDASRASRHAWLLVGSPALAGVICEGLKLMIRRERPGPWHGESVFRAFSDHPWSTAGLATPSSHTMVAFGALAMMARIFPRATGIWYALAWGCGLTRILDHAHFVSDVTFAAVLGWAVAWGLWMHVVPKREAA